MSNYIATSDDLTAVADAIRAKTGKSDSMVFPSGFVSEIAGIEKGRTILSRFESEMADTVSKVNALTASGDCYVLLITTDTHAKAGSTGQTVIAEATVPNMAYLCEKVQVDEIVHMGDLIDGSETKEVSVARIKSLRDSMRETGKPWCVLMGNHDSNNFQGPETATTVTDQAISRDEFFQMCGKHADRVDSSWYGYKDIDSIGLRIVYLCSHYSDSAGGGYGTSLGYPSEELTWVQDVALDTDYAILFLSHMGMVGADCQYGTQQNNGQELKAIIDAAYTAGKSIVGYFSGHNHWDNVTDYGYQYVSTAGNGVWNASQTSDIPSTVTTAKRWARSLSDYTEDMFDAVVINMTDKTVNLVRFGAGEDRAFAFSGGTVTLKILTQPADVTVYEGSDATTSITVNKTDGVTYEWHCLLSDGTDYKCADIGLTGDQSSLTVPGAMVTVGYDMMQTYCIVSDGTTTITSDKATLHVNSKPASYTNVLDDAGYENGKYLSGNGTGTDSNGFMATGYIPITLTASEQHTIYIKGDASNPGWAEQSHCRMSVYASVTSTTTLIQIHSYSSIKQYFTVTQLGDYYYKLEPKTTGNYLAWNAGDVGAFRMSLLGDGAKLIMTIDEEITDS